MKQPSKNNPILPREWVHKFHKIEIINKKTREKKYVYCNSSNTFITDLNPIWFVYSIMKTKSRSLYILYLDTTNKCNDNCDMCFSKIVRQIQGTDQEINVDLALKRITELKNTYPTFQVVSMAGPGEPLLLSRLKDILVLCHNLGITTRVFTNGEMLSLERIREMLLRYSGLVRISVDAASEHTHSLIHGGISFQKRIDSIKKLIEDKKRINSETLIGVHFVIQKDNYREIMPFANLFRELGVDFVVYSQETLGNVKSVFTDAELNHINKSLDTVSTLHCDDFAVIIPAHVLRKTFKKYNEEYYASPDKLNMCFNGSSRLFFSSTNKISACWLDNSNKDFIQHSYIGELSDDMTMTQIHTMIREGIGSLFPCGAYLGCDYCFSKNYNNLVHQILSFTNGYNTEDIEVKLVKD